MFLICYYCICCSSSFFKSSVGYRCGLQREKFPDLHAFRVNIHSLVAIICINITEISPRSSSPTKTVATLQGGHRFIQSRQGLKPLPTESQTSGTFQRKAYQWGTRGTRPSADRKNCSNKPVHLRKVQEKIRRNQESSCEKRIHWTLRANIQNLSFSSKGNCAVFKPLSNITC